MITCCYIVIRNMQKINESFTFLCDIDLHFFHNPPQYYFLVLVSSTFWLNWKKKIFLPYDSLIIFVTTLTTMSYFWYFKTFLLIENSLINTIKENLGEKKKRTIESICDWFTNVIQKPDSTQNKSENKQDRMVVKYHCLYKYCYGPGKQCAVT
jgi:hypothetical protein